MPHTPYLKRLIAGATYTFLAHIACSAPVEFRGATHHPQVQFAQEEIRESVSDNSSDGTPMTVRFELDQNLESQAYELVVHDTSIYEIRGGDPLGMMYGGLRLAEAIKLNPKTNRVRSESGSPYLEYRGLKMNFPLDARTPSYDDTGDSAVRNIPTMWDLSFWKEHFDHMARHRYNALTLWAQHPFPSLVKLEDFPDVALENVCASTSRKSKNSETREVPQEILDNLYVVKTISIEEKIAHWQAVMKLAKNRGIKIYIITWNVHLDAVRGKYGITKEPDNQTTVEYMRACVRETLLTYPDLAGFGVTAGENMTAFASPEAKEKWLWDTYGKGVQDVKKLQPDREIRFIHRHWQSGLEPILDAFENFPGPFEFSFKYAKARLHSKPDPLFADPLIAELRTHQLKAWWNLRNDDLFNLRWGDPEYTRSMIKNMPPQQTAGFHMGSDGWVWARNFSVRDPQLQGRLEIDRHWYNFMQWGRLGYDPSLDRRFFERSLAERYPEVDESQLYETWTASSQIMPQINRFFFKRGDWMFSPEGSHSAREFLSVNDFIEEETMLGSPEISIAKFIALEGRAPSPKSVTPIQVAENLDRHAETARTGVERIKKRTQEISQELGSILTDIEAMSWLGHYYASKTRGATWFALYKSSGDTAHKENAIKALEKGIEDWNTYAAIAGSQYLSQELARGLMLDYEQLKQDVERDLDIVNAYSPVE